MQLKKTTVATILFGLVMLAMAAVYFRFNRGFAVDDSYITFRYALNALHGDGVSFNVGERYYGSTATGYALLLALLAGIGNVLSMQWATVPAVSTALSSVALAMMCYAGFRVSTRSAPVAVWASFVGWLVAAWLVFVSPLANTVPSHETYFYIGLLAFAAMLAFNRQSLVPAALVLVLATTVRPDSTLFALVVFALEFLYVGAHGASRRQGYVRVARAAVVYFIGFGLWICWTRYYYGTFLPGTMDAKKAQVLLGYWPLFNGDNFSQSMDALFSGHYWRVLFACALITHLAQVRLKRVFPFVDLPVSAIFRFGLAWLIFAVGLFSAYCVFTVTLWSWYVIPIGLALVLAFFSGTQSLFVGRTDVVVSSRGREYLRGGLLAVMLLLIVVRAPDYVEQLSSRMIHSHNVNDHLVSYDAIGQYLKAEEPVGTTVAMAEPGTFGYKLGRDYTIVDVLGLASPGVAKALRNGDASYALDHWKPKYAILSWEGSFTPIEQPGFFDHYQLVGVFEDPYWRLHLKRGAYLFRRLEEGAPVDDAGGAHRKEYPQALTYVSTSAAGLPPRASGATLACHIEGIGGKLVSEGATAHSIDADGLQVWGWAAGQDKRPLGDIFVVLTNDSGQDTWLRARSRLDRPDVGQALGQTDTRFSAGFQLNLVNGVVAPGHYTVHVLGKAANGMQACAQTESITLH